MVEMVYLERRLLLCLAVALFLVWAVLHLAPASCGIHSSSVLLIRQPSTYISGEKVYTYGREMPLIFIGGVPRSGTTLMRAMLDAHPHIRCGQETHVIPYILGFRTRWVNSRRESWRLAEAGLSREVLNYAIAAFALEIILRHGDLAPRLCNKDPLTLKYATYLTELFPNAKLIFMVRDGRATVHSIISRQVSVGGINNLDYRQSLMDWNRTISLMYEQCQKVGSSRCLMVPYEQLVLHPHDWMEKILNYIDVPWSESVLHHEDLIDKPGGVLLSRVEMSTDQVMKPINLEALSRWAEHIPPDVVRDMAQIAPMLSVLGYDPYANPPNYGSPDPAVVENTKLVQFYEGSYENMTLTDDLLGHKEDATV